MTADRREFGRGRADMQVAVGAGRLKMELEGQKSDATWASLSDELEGQKVLASRWNGNFRAEAVPGINNI